MSSAAFEEDSDAAARFGAAFVVDVEADAGLTDFEVDVEAAAGVEGGEARLAFLAGSLAVATDRGGLEEGISSRDRFSAFIDEKDIAISVSLLDVDSCATGSWISFSHVSVSSPLMVTISKKHVERWLIVVHIASPTAVVQIHLGQRFDCFRKGIRS